MKRTFFMAAFLSILLLGCATQKEWAATGGSRADGIVKLSYEQHELEQPILNEQQAINIATKRCNSWGYTGAEAFGGVTRTCQQWGGLSGCVRFLVTKEYQCTNATDAVSITITTNSQNPSVHSTPVTLGVQYLGVSGLISDSLGMKTARGAYIAKVLPESVAEKSGIQKGDIILRIGGKDILVPDDVPASLMMITPKSKVPITIWRNRAESLLFANF